MGEEKVSEKPPACIVLSNQRNEATPNIASPPKKAPTLMSFIKLQLQNLDELLDLEERMYWQDEQWRVLWAKEAKEKFRVFIKDYLTSYPKGCFGLVDEVGKLLGAMFLIKSSEVEPIPYLHEVSEHLVEGGKVAYVSFFVVGERDKRGEIAQKLYDEAEEVAFLKLRCETIAVVIYSSPLEERILKGNDYEKLNERFEWEIYPGKKVPCWIYYRNLLLEDKGSVFG